MKTLVTPLLIKFLQDEGYQYCLARKQPATQEQPTDCLIFSPLKQKPKAGSLPDRYFDLVEMNNEPAIFAEVPDGDILVMMDLTSAQLCSYLNILFNAQIKSA